MIWSGRNEKWFKEAQSSVLNQIYPLKLVDKDTGQFKTQIELKIVDNTKKEFTIGVCWNELIRKAEFDYIFILDDDDRIAQDLLFNLMMYFQTLKLDKKNDNIIGVSPYLTFFEEKKGKLIYKHSLCYTSGLIEKKWLLKIPFNEFAKKHVDIEWDKEIVKRGKFVAIQCTNLGYYYRQHDLMVSGRNMEIRLARNILQKNVYIKINGDE